MTIDEFFKIEDSEMRDYIFYRDNISRKSEYKEVDNDEKLGFYRILKKVKRNLVGTYYIHSELTSYIVYNKAKKTLKCSKNIDSVLDEFLGKYFFLTDIDMIKKFLVVTKCILKKIIQGKIHTIKDILDHRVKLMKGDYSSETLYKFMVMGYQGHLHLLEDPETLNTKEDFVKLLSLDSTWIYDRVRKFKVKFSNLNDLKKKYDEWETRESVRYAEYLEHRFPNTGEGDAEECIVYEQGTNSGSPLPF